MSAPAVPPPEDLPPDDPTPVLEASRAEQFAAGERSNRISARTELSPRRQDPAWILISAIRQAQGLVIPLVLLLVTGGARREGTFLVIASLVAVIGIVARTLAWWRFTYEVRDGTLRVYSGLLARDERLIPIERIQAIDASESPLQQLFNVVGLRIETAAGGTSRSDVVLQALAPSDAEQLRAILGRGGGAGVVNIAAALSREGDGAGGDGRSFAPVAEGTLVRRLSGGELFLAGATSGRIGPALAAVSFGVSLADDFLGDEAWARWLTGFSRPTLQGLVGLILVAAVVAWLFAVGGTVLTFAGFEVRRSADRLFISYGFFDRRRRSIPLRRVQSVVVQEGVLRQPFGRAAVAIESAGYAGASGDSAILFPLLRRSEVPALLRAAVPEFAAQLEDADWHRMPARARTRYLMAGVWPLLGLAAAAAGLAALLPGIRWTWGAIPLIFVPVAVVWGAIAFRDSGWRIDQNGLFVLRAGGLARRTTVMMPRRIQIRAVVQDLLQRRSDLATLVLAVASGGQGGRARLRHLDAETALDLADRLAPARRIAASAAEMAESTDLRSETGAPLGPDRA